MSGFVNVSYKIIVMSVVMGLNQKPERNSFVRGTSCVYFAKEFQIQHYTPLKYSDINEIFILPTVIIIQCLFSDIQRSF